MDLAKRNLGRNHAKCVKVYRDIDSDILISNSILPIVSGAAQYHSLTNVCSNIGRNLQNHMNQPHNTNDNVRVGWFVLTAYVDAKLIEIKIINNKKRKKAKHNYSYKVRVINQQGIHDIFEIVMGGKLERNISSAGIFPSTEPEVWSGAKLENGLPIIKRMSQSDQKQFVNKDNKYIFETLNKLNKTGWIINKRIYEVFEHYLTMESGKNPFKHKNMVPLSSRDHQVRASHKLQAETVYRMARILKDEVFYQTYNLDFRGRIYPCTVFLNEQAGDYGKSLLNFAMPSLITREGLTHMLLAGANSYGMDKLSLKDKLKFMEENRGMFLRIGEDPYENTEWMDTEEPWKFLSFCQEYSSYLKDPNNYKTHVPIYVDASCNGSQHLSAMSMDDTIGSLVNLTPSERPRDLYQYIADKTWEELDKKQKALTKEEKDSFDSIFETLKTLRKNINEASLGKDTEKYMEAIQEFRKWCEAHRELRRKLFCMFFGRIEDKKLRRKIVKRPCMTLCYGATKYGFGEQVYDDSVDLSPYLASMDNIWAMEMGRLLYDVCFTHLHGPALLLKLFTTIANNKSLRKQLISWEVPITGFRVRQKTYKPSTARIKLMYKRKRYRIYIKDYSSGKIDTQIQRNSTSPNLIHSIDAAHMMMVTCAAKFPTVGIHDSFGCLPSDMERLHEIVREQFIRLYESDPLDYLIKQFGEEYQILVPKKGSLDLQKIKESSFAFH